jgi:Zn-dependent protease
MVLVPMILALTVHEYAHAWASYQLGDDTAHLRGRLNLNPASHIDPLGTIGLPLMLLFFSHTTGALGGLFFGWAKPVPFDPSRFTRKITVRTGMLIVAAAGPLSNLIMALVCAGVLSFLVHMGWGMVAPEPVVVLLQKLLGINIALFVFNMIPVYPLDGQKVLSGLLPAGHAVQFERFSFQFGRFLLIGVFLFATHIVAYPYRLVLTGILRIVGLH